MATVRFILNLLIVFSCACIAVAIPTQFENSKVIRTFEIKSGIAIEDTGIRAKNVDNAPATEYYFLLPNVLYKNAASVVAFLRKEKTELEVSLEGLDAER